MKFLEDKSKTGKVRPWKQKKQLSMIYAQYLNELGYSKKSERVEFCGEFLEFAKVENELKLSKAYFCKSKLCALCSWRRSLKNSFELKQILDNAYQKYPKARFLFLTLTEENAEFGKLKDAVAEMQKASNKLFRYKKVAQNLIGYARSTEITVNRTKKTFHQHMHVLLMVNPSYFNKGHYLSQDDWSNLWQKARKLDYKPVVNIQVVKPSKKDGELVASAKEVAKYTVKSSDYISDDSASDKEIIKELETALHHKRQISFGGLFKEIRKELQLDKKEDDLIHVDDKLDTNKAVDCVVYRWNKNFSNYVLFKN